MPLCPTPIFQALCRGELASHPVPQVVLAATNALVAGGGLGAQRIFKHEAPAELVDALMPSAGEERGGVGGGEGGRGRERGTDGGGGGGSVGQGDEGGGGWVGGWGVGFSTG